VVAIAWERDYLCKPSLPIPSSLPAPFISVWSLVLSACLPVRSACGEATCSGRSGSSKLCTKLHFHWPIRWHQDNLVQLYSWFWLL